MYGVDILVYFYLVLINLVLIHNLNTSRFNLMYNKGHQGFAFSSFPAFRVLLFNINPSSGE